MRKYILRERITHKAMEENGYKPSRVICAGKVLSWYPIGPGWVEIGEASEPDYDRYPIVTDEVNEQF